MTLQEMIILAREQSCSDIHLSEGMATFFRKCGRLHNAGISMSDEAIRNALYATLSEEQQEMLLKGCDLDYMIQTTDGNRQRVNIFRQQGRLAAAIRLLYDHIPSLKELRLPSVLGELAAAPRGLVLVTGPAGSGKSTTLAAMVNEINNKQANHIVTIEDPIEYIFAGKKSLIHQREVGSDTDSFAAALRSALREDPDVILVGEMRDYETISAAVTAAETGHLVLSTLHTTGAAQTIDRIIDVCPGSEKLQMLTQLSGTLRGVVTQCLIPAADGQERVAATEIMTGTDAVLNLIRENKCHQMHTIMQAGGAYGMHTLNQDLSRLTQSGQITAATAYQCTNDRKDLEHYLQ